MRDELQVNEVFLVGRVVDGPIETDDGRVHYRFDVGQSQPIHLTAYGKTAENLIQFVGSDDEMSVEGQLEWLDFPNSGPTLIVNVRYASYGRKSKPIRQGPRLS